MNPTSPIKRDRKVALVTGASLTIDGGFAA
jgi:hypothetical protein